MINIETNDSIFASFLFKNIDEAAIKEISDKIKPEIQAYKAKETIYTPSSFESKIGFIISGECLIERVKCDGTHIPLNLAKAGDSFGITAALNIADEFPTRISARKNSKIAFIDKTDLEYLIENYNPIAKNVISFLCKKVIFLNNKIATFSSSTVEEKLASFILLEHSKFCKLEFAFNCKKTAESINSGRASLYRAIASLTEKGMITLSNKKIIILDLKGLERISK